MSRTAPRCRCSGFTLVELMVTVSVLVILISVATPGLSSFVSRNHLAAVQGTLAGSMALARAEAARTGVPVIVQAATGGPPGDEFANGWDLYLDNDLSGTVSSGDTLIRHYEALGTGVSVSGGVSLVFSAGGYLKPAAGVNYRVCRSDGSTAGYNLSVAPSGSTYVAAIANCP